MQTQRTVTISSPAVREDYIQMAPHIFAPTVLDKTPSERTCPSRGARGSEGPTRGRRQPGGRQEGRHAPSRAVHPGELRHPRRPLQEGRHHHQPVSRSEHGLPQGPRIDHPWWPSVVCSLERTAPYRTSQTNTWSAWRGAALCRQYRLNLKLSLPTNPLRTLDRSREPETSPRQGCQ